MAWQLRGQLVENCSCNMFCPCWFGVQELMIMDQGWCAGAIALRIEEGDSEGLDLGGRTIAMAVHFPGPTLFDGGATARLYVDDGATDEQRAELETITQGRKGGPMEVIAGLVSDWLPTASAAFDISEDGETISIGVGDTGRLGSRLLRDPDGNDFTLRGGGFVTGFGLDQAQLAPPVGGRWSDDQMPGSVEMKSGARGAFAWAG